MKKKKILVVDDESAVCKTLKKFLEKKQYVVSTSLSGEDAIKKVKAESPHAVLLDIRMPGMDGVEALQKIKKINNKINVVMITAVNDDEVGNECLKMGACDYITKPLSLDYLENVLMLKLAAV